ncbi:MAG: hypothetical protein HY823_05635 [Acidobacteria bacterium]|nr:hypothetical protein [Acidobacteriota bacterium]
MNDRLLITLEILVVIVGPLLFLYLKGPWPLRRTLPSLLVLPLLWYLTYAPTHELSHVAGTYLVGGRVVDIQWIPRFWRGEFGQAWITPVGLSSTWQSWIMTASPYILDAVSLGVGHSLLRRRPPETPFVAGLLLMILCLRPAFDFVCETLAFAQGRRADLFHLAQGVGAPALGILMVVCIGLSLAAIASILHASTKAPEA